MVVWNNESSGRRSNEVPQVEEGALVREQQTLIRLPDLSNMQVKVNVHETKVEQIQLGMPATIRIQDRKLSGSVVTIANQPQPTSWFSPDVKEYATSVKIAGEAQGLKPGMTAATPSSPP
jgi:multidrug resistance efflux pump